MEEYCVILAGIKFREMGRCCFIKLMNGMVQDTHVMLLALMGKTAHPA